MSLCAFCHEPTKYENGGFTALAPLGQAHNSARACQSCTTGLVCAWAKEAKRLDELKPRKRGP